MSDEPIKHDKIIEPKVFQPAADSADVLLEKLSLLIGGFRELAKITGAKINSGIDPKSLSDVEKLAKETQKLSDVEKGLTEVQKVQVQVQQIVTKQKTALREQIKGEESAYAALSNQYKEAAQKAKDLAASQGISSKASKQAAAEARALNDKLKTIDATLGNHQRNVGNYGSALKGVGKDLHHASQLTGVFESETQKLSIATKVFNAIAKANPLFFIAAIIASVIAALIALRDKIKFVADIFEFFGNVIGGVTQALKDFGDWMGLTAFAAEEKAERIKKAAEKEQDAIKRRYDLEIKLADIAGKTTLGLERLQLLQRQKFLKRKNEQELLSAEESEKLINELASIEDALIVNLALQRKAAVQSRINDEKDLSIKIVKEKKKEVKEKEIIVDEAATKEIEVTKEKNDGLEIIEHDFTDKINYIKEQGRLQDDADARRHKREQLQETIETIDALSDAIFEGLEERSKREIKINQEKISAIEKEEDFQRQLALEGEKNNYAELKKEKAQALEEQAKLEKKAAREREAEKFVEIFLEFYKTYAKEGDKAFGKALKSTMMAIGGKMIAKGLAGAFAEGVEDLKGKGTGTSDSNVALLSKGESVTTAKGTSETKGLVTAVNKDGFLGAKEWAMQNIFPKIPIQDKSRSEQLSESLLSVLHSDIKELQKTIKDKKELHIHRNILGELVIGEKENGIHNQTTQKNTPIIYTR